MKLRPETLKIARVYNEDTQEDVARLVGCCLRSIRNWEHGRQPIRAYRKVLWNYLHDTAERIREDHGD